MRSLLIVVSAPSGAGKTTLCDRLLAECAHIDYSISCTTRPPRGKEVDGVDYFFLSEETFLERVEAGDFLEHATVHGYRYGTLRKNVMDAISAGRSVLMDIDVQGAAQIRAALESDEAAGGLAKAYVDIFITVPSLSDLEKRLCARGEDAEDVIEKRMAVAEEEMRLAKSYMYVIVNDEIERAYEEFRQLVKREMESG